MIQMKKIDKINIKIIKIQSKELKKKSSSEQLDK